MTTLVICQDSPDAPTLRQTHLQAHLEYIETIVDKISAAGPLSQSDQSIAHGAYDGSCFIYTTDDIDEAQALFNNDPYVAAGVYASASFSKFNPVAGNWVGGTNW